MIIINAGLPKSGTTLVQQYQIDLIDFSNPSNGQLEIFNYGYNIDVYSDSSNRGFFVDIDEPAFQLLTSIESEYGDFVVKTHCVPNLWIHKMITENGAKATFCYRDLRDIILSALDHGKRTRAEMDRSGAYRDLQTIGQGIDRIKQWFEMFVKWQSFEKVLMIKYEEMMYDKEAFLITLSSHLQLSLPESDIFAILAKHESLKHSAWNFNVGKIYRWRDEMSREQIQECNEALREEILYLGYSLD
ncbi:MAG: sulfotransferase domain-containing protein [Bacteroidota bacterium]